jgi:benzodiazapine receptor
MPKNLPSLALLLVLCFGVAGVGGLSTASAVTEWYPTLVRPPWRPPDWLFGPVWTVLYTMMAVAMWNVWRQTRWPDNRAAVVTFGAQLALNALWSPLFFGARNLGAARGAIALMWLGRVATNAAFWPRSRASAGLMVPYLAWVSFAATLNAWLWWMN